MWQFIFSLIGEAWRKTPHWLKFIYVAMILSQLIPACFGDALGEVTRQVKYEECMAEYQSQLVCSLYD